MHHDSEEALDRVFMALADKTRRQIVHLVAEKERTISELSAPFDMSMAAVSKHVKILEKAKILQRRVDGRIHYCTLAPEQLAPALDWVSIYRNFWQQRLDTLDDLITPANDNT
ncbi:helix-turn-helix transcriptional regulator [Pleionea sp. CnH1-48]|uniref:ArsR/SmtB family transcription factor n=1 Tax=Pleionea sp. CnH1-48 TaxID=2954494 RepID=UPI0020968547|nr:metalloregulator ArsR/SmtB family transcription factor [Pleionea sp. CnH1-48]MCO7226387.1 metalloregulator ArsR/SmtB family transcription factor [Pleionea sp. CnH1-48]